MRLTLRRTSSSHSPHRRRRLLALGLVATLGGAATAVALQSDEPELPEPIYVTGSTFIPPLDLTPKTEAAKPKPKPKPVIKAGSPRRLVIPTLGVDSEILPITAPGGVLTPPDDAQQIGWWSPGAEPGAATGSALLTGHTLSRGGAALQDLETLAVGDRIEVRTATGRIAYKVRGVEIFSKGALALEAQNLFSQTAPGRLVVITCEDYNGSVYLSNVVVTAAPIGSSTSKSWPTS